MKKSMTAEELFDEISYNLKEQGKPPAILTYGLESCNPVPIITNQFDLRNRLSYRVSEGICLDLRIAI